MDRAEKEGARRDAQRGVQGHRVVVVAHYSGLTVAQMNDSASADEAGGRDGEGREEPPRQVALEGTDAASIAALFKGPTVIAYSDDPVAAPKVAVDFAKANDKFVILGGALGKTVLDADGVKALAALPSLDELRAKIVGLIQAPATKIARCSARRRPSSPACSGLRQQGRGGVRPFEISTGSNR